MSGEEQMQLLLRASRHLLGIRSIPGVGLGL